ncbi:DUF5658 family protein [Clostridium chrysemydis]|uniref:DUF5658 family protein n=1 Tax=Clostridium chrysemydis TaxID=2665504 RepID=UPI003B75C241
MLNFLKANSVHITKFKLKLLYILNVFDIIFTLLLLETGIFKEANLFMRNIVESPILSIFIKIVLVFFLIKYLLIRIEGANLKQLKISNYILNFTLAIYIAIIISHIFYFAIFFYIKIFI